MYSAKHNSTMERNAGLLFSLLNFASSQDASFCQPQQIHNMHHGAVFALLYVPFLFTDNTKCRFAIAQCGFPLAFLLCLSKQPGFIAERFYSLEMLCNEWSIAPNEKQWLPHFLVYN